MFLSVVPCFLVSLGALSLADCAEISGSRETVVCGFMKTCLEEPVLIFSWELIL